MRRNNSRAEGRTQKYVITTFHDYHVDGSALSRLFQDIMSAGGSIEITDNGVQFGIPVGKRIGNRRLRDGRLGIYLKQIDGDVTVGHKWYGRKSRKYTDALDYVMDKVVAEGGSRYYADAAGNKTEIPTPLELFIEWRGNKA